jgi:hypothetical protein
MVLARLVRPLAAAAAGLCALATGAGAQGLNYVYVPLADPADQWVEGIKGAGPTVAGWVFRPNDRGTTDPAMVAWDATTGQRRAVNLSRPRDLLRSTPTGAYGDRVIGRGFTVPGGDQAYLWDLSNGAQVSLRGTGWSSSFAAAIQGELIVGSKRAGAVVNGTTISQTTAVTWSLASGAPVAADLSRGTFLHTEATHLGGGYIAGAGWTTQAPTNKTLVVWDAATGEQRAMDFSGIYGVQAFGISGGVLVGRASPNGTSDYRSYAWDLVTGQRTSCRARVIRPSRACRKHRLRRGGRQPVGPEHNRAAAWDVRTGEQINLNRASTARGPMTGLPAPSGRAPSPGGPPFGTSRPAPRRTSKRPSCPGIAFNFDDSYADHVTDTGVIVGRWRGGAFGGGDAWATYTLVPFSSSAPAQVGAGQTATSTADFTQQGGAAVIDGAMRFVGGGADTYTLAEGTLTGTGTILGDLVNTGGVVNPGASPGTLTVGGDFTQGGGGTLLLEAASTAPGGFDVLDVDGSAALGGTLRVVLQDGYTPQLGAFFDFLTTGAGVAGGFASISDGWAFSAVGGGRTGRLTFVGAAAVPEAGTLPLGPAAGATVFGAALKRRRRRN